MTRNMVCLRPQTTLRSAASTLRRKKISGAPVVNLEGRLVGVLSERDIVEAVLAGLAIQAPRRWLDMILGHSPVDLEAVFRVLRGRLSGLKVEDVMSIEVVSVPPEMLRSHAAERMDVRGLHRLMVVRGGKLVGVVARSDLR